MGVMKSSEIEVPGKYISNDDESMIRLLNEMGIIQHSILQSLNISRGHVTADSEIGPFIGFYICFITGENASKVRAY